MKLGKLNQFLKAIDPKATEIENISDAELRSLLFPAREKGHLEILSPKQRRFIGLLAEAQAEYISREVDVVQNPERAIKLAQWMIGNKHNENFLVILLNSKNQVMDRKVLFSGSIGSAKVYYGEIARYALVNSARSIIVAHNHPSQDVKPSYKDLEMTMQLHRALSLLQIQLLDHLVVSAIDGYSISEQHPELWYRSGQVEKIGINFENSSSVG